MQEAAFQKWDVDVHVRGNSQKAKVFQRPTSELKDIVSISFECLTRILKGQLILITLDSIIPSFSLHLSAVRDVKLIRIHY